MTVELLFSGENGVEKVDFWDQLTLATTILEYQYCHCPQLFVYQYCKVFQNFCIVMDVYLRMCVITTGNV